MASIYSDLLRSKQQGKKKFAVLVDPDHVKLSHFERIISHAVDAKVDYIFIGGSLIVNNRLDDCLKEIKKSCDIPMILFPGDSMQLSYQADAILFLSLISGRNAELLIGKHVISAPYLKVSPLEILSTGYMLVDGGVATSVSYISNTAPIPANKEDIAVCTALAGEMLGLKQIFMDAGSGAINPVSEEMISAVSSAVQIPLIVGGGIRTPEAANVRVKAGADVIVVGNAIEKDPQTIHDISAAIHQESTVLAK